MAKKQSSSRVSAIAARGVRAPSTLTTEEVKAVCASVLAQDETKGQNVPWYRNPFKYLTRG